MAYSSLNNNQLNIGLNIIIIISCISLKQYMLNAKKGRHTLHYIGDSLEDFERASSSRSAGCNCHMLVDDAGTQVLILFCNSGSHA